MKRRVYLCGPITAADADDARTWRSYVRSQLEPTVVTIDPTRDGADPVVRAALPGSDRIRLDRTLHGKEVLDRDRMDLGTCDLVLANFLEAKRVSIGSVGEIFWADAFRKLVVVVREPEGNPHDHDMLNSIASVVCFDLETAVEKVKILLATA